MSTEAYTVIYEQASDGGWGAYALDLPGLGVVGETLQEVELLIRDGIEIYLEELRLAGQPRPLLKSVVGRVEVSA